VLPGVTRGPTSGHPLIQPRVLRGGRCRGNVRHAEQIRRCGHEGRIDWRQPMLNTSHSSQRFLDPRARSNYLSFVRYRADVGYDRSRGGAVVARRPERNEAISLHCRQSKMSTPASAMSCPSDCLLRDRSDATDPQRLLKPNISGVAFRLDAAATQVLRPNKQLPPTPDIDRFTDGLRYTSKPADQRQSCGTRPCDAAAWAGQ